jgi:hypothetical protein
MRVAVVMLVVGCASQDAPVTIDIVTRPTEIEWFISPGASCSCQNVATFPASGSCTHDSDTPGCTCYPAACLDQISLVKAGTVIGGGPVSNIPVPSPGGGFAGDFTQPDLTLRFEGCGEDANAPLTNVFPDPVTPMLSTDKTQLSWSVVPNDGFLVLVAGEFWGELCRTDPDARSQTIDLPYFTSVGVRTLHGPTTTNSGAFTFHVWSTSAFVTPSSS